jgi:thioredoxin reductase (NADPH)
LKTVKFRDQVTGEIGEIHPAAAFIFIGQMPNVDFLKDYAELDPYGFVMTGHDITHTKELENEPLPFETSVPGIFAAGDVRHGSTKQVASAVGEGAAASISIREFLRRSE